jgi:hypothetical protein
MPLFSVNKTDITKMETKKDLKSLTKATANKDPEIRQAALDALGRINDLQTQDPIIACLNDPDIKVKNSAITALSKMATLKAVQSVAELLNDENFSVRLNAALFLGEKGDSRAKDLLIIAFNEGYKRSEILSALGKLNDPEAQYMVKAYKEAQAEKEKALRSLASSELFDTDISQEDRVKDRTGICSNCHQIMPLSKAVEYKATWDRTNAYYYFCPTCNPKPTPYGTDFYNGRLSGNNKEIIDQVKKDEDPHFKFERPFKGAT